MKVAGGKQAPADEPTGSSSPFPPRPGGAHEPFLTDLESSALPVRGRFRDDVPLGASAACFPPERRPITVEESGQGNRKHKSVLPDSPARIPLPTHPKKSETSESFAGKKLKASSSHRGE